jgi:predicted  nucleic acid-binding Zn-ribbon protein
MTEFQTISARVSEEKNELDRRLAQLTEKQNQNEELLQKYEIVKKQKKKLLRVYHENKRKIRSLETDRDELVTAIERLNTEVQRTKWTMDAGFGSDEAIEAWKEVKEGLGIHQSWRPMRIARYVLRNLGDCSGRVGAAADLRTQVSALEREIHSLRNDFGSDR